MYGTHNKSTTTVNVDITPISFQCYGADKCPAVHVLQERLPSVQFEPMSDGTVSAKCPLSVYAQAQEMVRATCFGCRARE